MPRARAATTKTRRIVVLLVGASTGFVLRCRDAAARAGAMLRDCDPASAASIAEDWGPIALLVTERVYQSLARDLDAVARAAEATLVRLPGEELSDDELDGKLKALVAELA